MPTAFAQDCTTLDDALKQAESAVIEARIDDTDAALRLFEQSLGCDAVAKPEQLARIWLTEGAMLSFDGDPEGAVDAYVAAARVHFSTWNEDLGPKVKAEYDAAVADMSHQTATLGSDTKLPDGVAWLDGKPTTLPTQVTAGLHAIQVAREGNPPIFGRIFYLGPDQSLQLEPLDLASLGEAVVEQPVGAGAGPVFVLTPRQDKVMLFAAGGTAVAAGVLAFVAARQPGVQADATSLAELKGSRALQIATGLASYGAVAGSVGFVGLHFVPVDDKPDAKLKPGKVHLVAPTVEPPPEPVEEPQTAVEPEADPTPDAPVDEAPAEEQPVEELPVDEEPVEEEPVDPWDVD